MPRHISANGDAANDFAISLANNQTAHAVDERELVAAARGVLQDSKFTSATISLAVVDDETMQELNRRYLSHDWPTDVLSFVLDASDGHVEGEIVISADTAAAAAAEVGWPAAAEQLLYVIHGTLHLAGYNDKSPAEASQMRAAEARYLEQFALQQPGEQVGEDSSHAASVTTGGQQRESAP